MEIGVMLSCPDLDSVERKAALAQAAGFGCCQVTVLWEATPGEAPAIDDICRRHGMDVVAYGAYVNLLRPDDVSFHGVSIRAAQNLIEGMRTSRCRRIVVWSGTYGRRLDDADPRNWTPEARHAAAIQARDLDSRLRVHGGQLCIEPHHSHVLSAPEDCLAFAQEVDREVVRVVLDPPSLVPPGRMAELPELLPSMVALLAPVTGLIHLKGSRAPDAAGMDYARFLAEVKANGIEVPAVIEHVNENSAPDMRRERQRMERFLPQ